MTDINIKSYYTSITYIRRIDGISMHPVKAIIKEISYNYVDCFDFLCSQKICTIISGPIKYAPEK